MAKDPDYITKLKAFTRGELVFTDLMLLEKELYGENDRATAVLLSNVVEGCLTVLVKKRLRADLNSDDRRLLFDS